jgi:hypothetical protein
MTVRRCEAKESCWGSEFECLGLGRQLVGKLKSIHVNLIRNVRLRAI